MLSALIIPIFNVALRIPSIACKNSILVNFPQLALSAEIWKQVLVEKNGSFSYRNLAIEVYIGLGPTLRFSEIVGSG